MNHSFNTKIAEKYGIEEAIILENLYFWIKKNKANNKHFYDGFYWTYNSVKAMQDLFPYMSTKTITNTISNLVKTELIQKGNYNTSSYDRTNWFALTNLGESLFDENRQIDSDKNEKSIYPNRKMDLLKTKNRFTEKDEPIPYINTYINTNNNTDNKIKNVEINSTYKPLVDSYFSFYKKQTNTDPIFSGAEGKAIKKIQGWLEKNATGKEVETLNHVFQNWSKLDKFYQGQIEIKKIASNWSMIIAQLTKEFSQPKINLDLFR
jgi:DNA-binding HxlR family transcriptional regulator